MPARRLTPQQLKAMWAQLYPQSGNLRKIFQRYRRQDIRMADVGRKIRLPSGRQVTQMLPELPPESPSSRVFITPGGKRIARYGHPTTFEGRKNVADEIRRIRREEGRNINKGERRVLFTDKIQDAVRRRLIDRRIPLAKTRRKRRILEEKRAVMLRNQRMMRDWSMKVGRELGEL